MAKIALGEGGFDDGGFWRKIRKYAKKVGREGVEQILQLYYAVQAPTTPKEVKIAIYGALAYFVWPLDAMTDPIFVDDLGVIAAVALSAKAYVTPEIEEKAKRRADEWFGEENEDEKS